MTNCFYEAIRIIGGPRSARLVAQNLYGPSDTKQRRVRAANIFNHHPSQPNDAQFAYVAEIYKNLMHQRNITGPVPVETAEDETVTVQRVQWDIKTDECWGWCGEKGANHECDPSFVHVIGEDEDAFERLKNAFARDKIGGYARVVMLNPLHRGLPPMVVLLQACCNTFKHDWVRAQHDAIRSLYN